MRVLLHILNASRTGDQLEALKEKSKPGIGDAREDVVARAGES